MIGITLLLVRCGGSTSLTSSSTTTEVIDLNFFVQPTTTETGAVMADIQVEILDAAGVRDATATDNITLAIGTDPSGMNARIQGTLTVAAIGGTATFTDLDINQADTGYTFDFTATGLTTATSAAFK